MVFNFTVNPSENDNFKAPNDVSKERPIDIYDLQMAIIRWARRVKYAHREIDTDLMRVYVDNHFSFSKCMPEHDLKLFCQERMTRIKRYYLRILLNRAERAIEVMNVPNKQSNWYRPFDDQYVSGNCILDRTIIQQLDDIKTCYLENNGDTYDILSKIQALRGSFDTAVSPLDHMALKPATIDVDTINSYRNLLMDIAGSYYNGVINQSGDLNTRTIDMLMEVVEICAHLRNDATEMLSITESKRVSTVYAWACDKEKHKDNPIDGWSRLCKRNPLVSVGMCRNTTYRFIPRDPEPVTDDRDPAVRVLVDQDMIDRAYCSLQFKEKEHASGKGLGIQQ